MVWFQLVAGLYLMLIAFLFKTENVQSTIVFKLIPFVLGVVEALLFLFNMGVISIAG